MWVRLEQRKTWKVLPYEVLRWPQIGRFRKLDRGRGFAEKTPVTHLKPRRIFPPRAPLGRTLLKGDPSANAAKKYKARDISRIPRAEEWEVLRTPKHATITFRPIHSLGSLRPVAPAELWY